MAMITNIEVPFFEDNSTKPRFVINSDDSTYEVSKQRWVQFLILLTYQRLTNINDGWVTLEDVSRLSTFRRLKQRAIGKYISESIIGLPLYLQYFITKYLDDINTTGPYKLLIKPAFINADISKIKIYLNQVSPRNPSTKNDNQDLWEASKTAFSKYNLSSSRELASAYIRRAKDFDYSNQPNIAEIYIRLAEIERRCYVKKLSFYYTLGRAKQICKDILQPELKRLIMAYILSTHALLVNENIKNKKLIVNLIEKSMDLIRSDKLYKADRYCLIAGRYFHLASLASRADDYNLSKDSFVKAIINYRRMEEYGPTKIVNCEKGIIEGSTLKRVISQRVNKLEHFSNDELCWYYEVVDSGRVSQYLTLSIGEWMLASILITKEYDEAIEIISDCLITHADLHETVIFQRLAKKYRELKNGHGLIVS
jgi:hypothetical protein